MPLADGSRFLLALAFLALPLAAQGETGFLRGQGHTDVALTYGQDSYDEFWVGDTRMAVPDVGQVTRTVVNVWAAHGLREDLDLFGSATWARSESDGLAGFPDESDLQDLVLGAKWRAHETGAGPGRVSFLLVPSIKIPLTSYENDAVTAIGDGQVDLRLRGVAHYQAGGFWAALESGYDRRNGAPRDEVPVNLTLGLEPIEGLTVMPFYSLVASRGGIDIGDVPAQGGFPSTEEEYQRAGLQLFGRLRGGWGWTAGYRTTLDGKNTGDADSFWLGVVLQL